MLTIRIINAEKKSKSLSNRLNLRPNVQFGEALQQNFKYKKGVGHYFPPLNKKTKLKYKKGGATFPTTQRRIPKNHKRDAN